MSGSYTGWNVYILLRSKPGEGFDEEAGSFRRVTIRYSDKRGTGSGVRYIFWVARQMCILMPDVVLTFHYALAPFIVVLARLLRRRLTRIVINEGVLISGYMHHRHAAAFPLLIRFSYLLADAIIVPTRACKDDMVRSYGVPDKKISVISNWTCLPPMRPLPALFDCVYAGRFSPEKNPMQMIALTKVLVKRHGNIQIALIGSGALYTELIRMIVREDLKSNVRVLPFTKDIASVFRRSRILVVPSLVEGMPNVVLEAAMCGIPAVVNNFPGAGEVVRSGKTGYITTSVSETIRYIEYLLTHELERARMGKSARNYSKKMFSSGSQRRFIGTLLANK